MLAGMTLKNNRASLRYCFKLYASFCSHRWIQTGVTVRKRLMWVKICYFLSPVTLKFDRWPWKTIRNLFYAASNYVHHFVAFCEFKLEFMVRPKLGQNLLWPLWSWPFAWTSCLSMVITPENFMMTRWLEHCEQGKSEGFDSCDRPSNLTQIGFKSSIFRPCDLEIWWMTPKNNKTPLLYDIKFCVSFHIHQWIQTGSTVRKRPIWVKLDDFFSCVHDLAIWCMTLKNNRAPLLCYFKLCA